jgi:hypothetical protein
VIGRALIIEPLDIAWDGGIHCFKADSSPAWDLIPAEYFFANLFWPENFAESLCRTRDAGILPEVEVGVGLPFAVAAPMALLRQA